MVENENETLTIKEWHERAKTITLEALPDFLKELSEYPHTYNSIVSAIGAGAVATCWAMNNTENGGITGFQASCVMWDFVQNWMHYETPLKLIKYEDMLYPQYEHEFEKTISKETFEWLREEAEMNISTHTEGHVHPDVMKHWISIVNGDVPFCYKINEE